MVPPSPSRLCVPSGELVVLDHQRYRVLLLAPRSSVKRVGGNWQPSASTLPIASTLPMAKEPSSAPPRIVGELSGGVRRPCNIVVRRRCRADRRIFHRHPPAALSENLGRIELRLPTGPHGAVVGKGRRVVHVVDRDHHCPPTPRHPTGPQLTPRPCKYQDRQRHRCRWRRHRSSPRPSSS